MALGGGGGNSHKESVLLFFNIYTLNQVDCSGNCTPYFFDYKKGFSLPKQSKKSSSIL